MTIFRLQCPTMLCATLVGLSLLAAPAAQAFTFQDQGQDTASRSGGAANLTDLGLGDRHSSRFDDGKQPAMRQGNTSLQFGGQTQSFDQRNNPDSYFNPNVLMGR